MNDTQADEAAAHARLIEDNLVLTCEAGHLYRDGGFAGDAALLERLRERVSPLTEVVGAVFPGFPAHDPEPPRLFGGSAAFREKQGAALAAPRPPGPPTLLCETRDVRLAGNALFHIADGRPQVLFETYRPQERHVVPGPGPGFLHVDETIATAGLVFLLNSAGSFNYGHWLIDDLPRLHALALLRKRHPRVPITVALVSYFPHIDAARRRSIQLLLRHRVSIRFLDRDKTYRFARLHHATPCSLPSTGKSPHALRYLTGQMRARTRLPRGLFALRTLTGRGRRLFVDRHPGRGRGLANRDAVLGLLRGLGFQAFDPELTSVRQQVVRFSAAEIVVGIAGAGMANTVFCRPGTPVIHLVPEGWEDRFYGEIATACGQDYAAVFGPRIPSDAPEYLRDFAIDPEPLREALAAAGLR
ncbi:glycosyltransferase family 61 protein [Methylobacterium sp. AMS5]|uniref:glycosyltransferase family 61 protein n=1 Tax=Methylobacterium sp. AMS5 TaxID=925818 RepID=UPI00074F81EF|nr:glycosyltransferase family 61 protein [Methylobacterium sp. AMS5]AMB47542.1 capsular polysaccharide biosynthesis protein [Methylobacterium sp. AMS5]